MVNPYPTGTFTLQEAPSWLGARELRVIIFHCEVPLLLAAVASAIKVR
jgi:hypothetical protein